MSCTGIDPGAYDKAGRRLGAIKQNSKIEAGSNRRKADSTLVLFRSMEAPKGIGCPPFEIRTGLQKTRRATTWLIGACMNCRTRKRVWHHAQEFTRRLVHTKGIESVWALLEGGERSSRHAREADPAPPRRADARRGESMTDPNPKNRALYREERLGVLVEDALRKRALEVSTETTGAISISPFFAADRHFARRLDRDPRGSKMHLIA